MLGEDSMVLCNGFFHRRLISNCAITINCPQVQLESDSFATTRRDHTRFRLNNDFCSGVEEIHHYDLALFFDGVEM